LISYLKREMEKTENPKAEKKIYICDPSKNNIDITNELNSTRDILAKISKMLNAEKTKNEKLNHEISVVRNSTIITSKCECTHREASTLST
jgi:hypothetical protein